ncbi:MAG: polyprenyl diphosphate synthase [Anaerolineae bacterium]
MAEQPLPPKVPRHIGIIMDGNGRWAQKRGLLRAAGHRAGTQNIRPLLESAVEFGVSYLTIWAFSTENWVRPRAEVDTLMSLVGESLDRWLPELHEKGVRLRHLGKLDRLPRPLQGRILDAVALTSRNSRLTLSVAFDYGGRDEIVRAVQKLVAEGVRPDAITEELISARLDTAGLPDPDLIIRTGGDYRVSNFMLWEAAYAEYYFTPTLWPDFDREELRRAIDEYGRRQRRFGGLPTEPQAPPESGR